MRQMITDMTSMCGLSLLFWGMVAWAGVQPIAGPAQAVSATGASTQQALPSKVETHRTVLPNGLVLVVREDHRAPVVVSQVWYGVGSAMESRQWSGISHVLEHMMFKGTSQVGPGEFSRLIAERGGQENAFTSYDYTGYYQVLPADALSLSLRLEADRMQHLLLQDQAYAKEMQVIMEERRMRIDDSPHGRTFERFMAAAHIANPYRTPIIGWMPVLKQLPIAAVRQWYQQWYAPNNATIVVVGDVYAAHVLDLVKQYFGDIPAKPHPSVASEFALPMLGRRDVKVEVPAKLPWLMMGYNVPSRLTAKQPSTPYALLVAAAVLDGGRSAWLAKHVIREQKIASNAGASYNPYQRHAGLFLIEATPSKGHDLSELERALLQQVVQLRDQPVSPAILAKIKRQVIAQHIFSRDTLMAQAEEIGRLESLGIGWQEADDFVTHIQAVTAAQVQAVAKQYLVDARLTVAKLIPLRAHNTH